MVLAALAKALVALCEAPMTGPSETLPVLEQHLAERLLDFDRESPSGVIIEDVHPAGR